jgi:hypothetical protein
MVFGDTFGAGYGIEWFSLFLCPELRGVNALSYGYSTI